MHERPTLLYLTAVRCARTLVVVSSVALLGCAPSESRVPVSMEVVGAEAQGPLICGYQVRHGSLLSSDATLLTTLDAVDDAIISGRVCRPDGGRLAGRLELSHQGDLVGSIDLGTGDDPWLAFSRRLGNPLAQGTYDLTYSGTPGSRIAVTDLEVRGVQPGGSTGPVDNSVRIFLISIDTLRADAVLNQEVASAVPNLHALAEDSQVFENAYAAASWTRPSHISILTGLLPAVHGVIGFTDQIPSKFVMLSEALQARGFQTFGMVADIVQLSGKSGFDQGFDAYVEYPGPSSNGARLLVRELREHLDGDMFVFFHAFDSHSDSFVLPYEGGSWTPERVEREFGVEAMDA